MLTFIISRVSANTAIYQSTSVVAFILSVPMLQERVTIFKITSVILTVVGVFLMSFFNCHMHGDSTEVSNMTKIELTGGVEDMDLDSGGGRHKDTPLGYVVSNNSTLCLIKLVLFWYY